MTEEQKLISDDAPDIDRLESFCIRLAETTVEKVKGEYEGHYEGE